MLDEQLKTRAVRGLAWSAVDRIGVQGLQFVVSVILARILSPGDYGLFGMILVFTALAELLMNSGFSQALVQKQDRDQLDFSSVFWLNLALAAALFALLYLAAPLVAAYYRAPVLSDLLRVLAVNLLVGSLAIVHAAKLSIAMNFKVTAVANLLSLAVSFGAAYPLAISGYGVWTLVWQVLIKSVVFLAVVWIHDRWLPDLRFSRAAIGRLFRFGSNLLLSGLIGVGVTHVYALIIGRQYPKEDLGFYTKGRSLAELPSSVAYSVISSVAFPLFSQLQDDRARLAEVYGKLMRVTALLIFPLMTGLAVVADPLVRLLLTDKWAPAVPLMQWLCFARLIIPISALNLSVLIALGRSDLFLRLDLLKIPILLATLAATVPLGLRAVVIGQTATALVAYFMNAYYPGRLIGHGALRQLRELWRVALGTAVMAAAMWASSRLVNGHLLKLAVAAPVGLGVYLGAVRLLRVEELGQIWRLRERLSV